MSEVEEKGIPQSYVRGYAKTWLEIAGSSEQGSPQEIDALRRSAYAADLLTAFRESQKGKS